MSKLGELPKHFPIKLKKKKIKIKLLGYFPLFYGSVKSLNNNNNELPIFTIEAPNYWEVPDYLELYYQSNIKGKFLFTIYIFKYTLKEENVSQIIKRTIINK